MAKEIRHVHTRRIAAPLSEVVAAVDALWSRTKRDALPRQLSGWRRTPAGAQGLAVGTRFGHGPFSFQVEQWDGQTLRARIDTAGFHGQHGFHLRSEDDHVVITHELDAQLTPVRWLLWQLFIASGHDWAVEAMFDRMQALLGAAAPERHTAPLGMRVFARLRRIVPGS
jgi:hypothetical protein